MKTKQLVTAAVLLALGTVLHLVIPGFVNGVKPDFLLAMMFLAIVINNSFSRTMSIGLVAGILAAFTTNFPGGEIPSVLDKVGSAILFYLLYRSICSHYENGIIVSVLIAVGTIISGAIFLGSAMALVGLPGGVGFTAMITAVVLPTAAANTVFGFVVYRLYTSYGRHVSLT